MAPKKANKKKKGAAAAAAVPQQQQQQQKAAAAEAKEDLDAGARAEQLKHQGNVAYLAKDYLLAIKLFSESLELDPSNASVFSNRSSAYAMCRDWPQALEDGEAAVRLKPDWFKGYFRVGVACEHLLRYPESLSAYRKGLELAAAGKIQDDQLVEAEARLTQLLAELKMTEAQMDQGRHPDADIFERMQHWLREGGAKFPKLYLQYYSDEYRGVHCLAEVQTGEQVLYVPRQYIMTSEVARESEIGRKLLESKVELRSKHSFLAAYLLVEKERGRESFWSPYIECLPQKYTTMPLFFDEPTLDLLQGSLCLSKIAERINSLRQEYDNIRRAVPEFNRFTLEDFMWARLVVITRIFGMSIDGQKTDGLVPYADMLNHKRPRETQWSYEDAQHGFIISALQAIPRGAQCYDSYGRKCNSRFFVNYGFALEDNPDNECVINVQLDPKDAGFVHKMRLLNNRAQAQRRQFQVPALFPDAKTNELLSFMRFANCKDSELMLISSAAGDTKLNELKPTSIETEIAALRDIARAAQVSLKLFPTSLEEDLKQLEAGVEDFNLQSCLLVRAGEKRALHWFVELANRAIPMLQMPWRELKRVADKCYKSEDPMDTYVTTVVVPLVKRS